MAAVPLRVLGVLHRARRSDVAGVSRVVRVSRVVCVRLVAGMSGVVVCGRRVTGMRAVSRVLRGSFALRVGRHPLISRFVLGIVAHAVTLPNIRGYALFPSPHTTSGRSVTSQRESAGKAQAS
jgi:hypothetical protein